MTRPEALLRVCLVEDDEIMGDSLAQLLRLEGFAVERCRTAAAARAVLERQRYCVVVSDIRLPDGDGGAVFLDLKAAGAALPPFLFMTGYGTIDRAVELIKAGAADYVTKPFDAEALVNRVRSLAQEFGAVAAPDTGATGGSSAMRRIAETLPRLARHASSLLITGESGVGKEHVAHEFHRLAGTSGEFVAVNCAAIPESLMESELFGHERGAFTGAAKAKRGYIEQAHLGTLFLDEIGEMPLAMQAKLLRTMQDRSYVRLGGEKPLQSDFRLVCATHRDLKAMVDAGSFREDLYYRIHVIELHIPPLRERPEDIRWFVRHFVEEFNHHYPAEPRRIDPRTERVLLAYAWPGNVRELKHAVERACILSPGPLLDAEAFFGASGDISADLPQASQSLADYLIACEKDFLIQSLEQHGGHMTRTAEALGITRKTLWEKLRRLDIRVKGEP
ncbi:MAG: sigma-54-dependent Fis family transcriptional regulator [Rhodocyclales bacterium]|nr:sigma-54-dependent Fis family transcriptional regulator [Rhodocyclales bacterium]